MSSHKLELRHTFIYGLFEIRPVIMIMEEKMKNLSRLVAIAALSILAFNSQAEELETAGDRIAHTFFATSYYSGFSGNWGLVDDLDFYTLKEVLGKRAAKASYVGFYHDDLPPIMQFDAEWTNKTLKRMYPDLAVAKERREAARDDGCLAKIEVGYETTYGLNGQHENAKIVELDGDTTGLSCPPAVGGEAASMKLRSWLSTVPGSKYELVIQYHKREYNGPEYKNLVVKIGGTRIELPFEEDYVRDDEGEMLYNVKPFSNGYLQATINFEADRFISKLVLNDTSYSDTYGVLINGLYVNVVTPNPLESACKEVYANDNARLKLCLNGDSGFDPVAAVCDLTSAKVVWNTSKAENLSGIKERSETENLFYQGGNDQFLSLGRKGKATITPQLNGKNAACPISGKTLSLQEITWGNKSYATYAERGIVNVKLKDCLNTESSGKLALTNIEGDEVIKTNDAISFTFDAYDEDGAALYQGCKLKSIHIADMTHKIKSTQAGYVSNSDGFDINAVSID